MKYYPLLLLTIFTLTRAAAQQVKPVYFYGEKVTTDKTKATSYAVYGKLSNENLWTFKRYNLYNELLQTGSYNDELLTTPHGEFTFYSDVEKFNLEYDTHFVLRGKTRFLSQIGSFVNGREQGKWLMFYPDGSVLNAQAFVNGKLHGESITYNKKREVLIKGNYVDGERDGEWIFKKGKERVVYEKGIIRSSVNGKNLKN